MADATPKQGNGKPQWRGNPVYGYNSQIIQHLTGRPSGRAVLRALGERL